MGIDGFVAAGTTAHELHVDYLYIQLGLHFV